MQILDYFQHINLTSDQINALERMHGFLNGDDRVFILQGYAGSGKTTLLKGLVEYLQSIEQNYQLMAPTGRAAKVINQKTGILSTTVHKGIYSFDDLQEIEKDNGEDSSFLYQYKIRNNPAAHNSILIIDEASMVSDVLTEGEFFRFGSGYLLRDLITYSRINEAGNSSKIIFVGDPAQLPPIGMNFSPALDPVYLEKTYSFSVDPVEIKEVKRQESDNGILLSATRIRQGLTSGFFTDFDLRENGKDLLNIKYEDFLTTYNDTEANKIIICYKNKTALELNKTIREDIFKEDLPIQPGDKVIVGHNNYRLGIMNGEFAIVAESNPEIISRTIHFKLKGGGSRSVLLRWRKVTLLVPDEQGEPRNVQGYSLENYLYGDNSINPDEQRALYVDFKNRHPGLRSKSEEFKEAIKNDPFFNCIQLKFGYAVTCHKAQGGEWSSAFVFWDRGTQSSFNFYDSEHDSSGKTNADFYRWAYTAVTRASKKLFCINPPFFSSFSNLTFIESNVKKAYDELTGKKSESIEIDLNEALLEQLEKNNLKEAPLSFQDHFIHHLYHLNQNGIEIRSWKQMGYEIWYVFAKNGKTAGLKYWVNKRNEFGPKFMEIPSQTTSGELVKEVTNILEKSTNVEVNRRTAEGILTKIQFDVELEESKPFLKNLYDGISKQLKLNESIEDLTHLSYKERYTFKRGNENCVVDFEYNSNGFFGRVVPLEKRCDGAALPQRIKEIVNHLKDPSYVI